MKNTKILKLLLAAGRSNRFGSQNKLLQLLNGKKIIQRTLENLLNIFNKKEILVVTGYQVKEIELSLKKYEIKTSYNNFYYKGMGTSISHAIKNNELNFDGVMIIPADMPLVTSFDYKKIIKAFEEADTGLVVIDGKLIEKPVMREMYRIVSIARKIGI